MRVAILALALGCTAADPDLSKGADDTEVIEPVDTQVDTDRPVPASCGDGVLDAGEVCDAGLQNGAEACGCQPDCRYAPTSTTCEDDLACTDVDTCDGAGGCTGQVRSCDDLDPCTADTCTEAAEGCVHARLSLSGVDLFDMSFLADPSTLDVVVVHQTVAFENLRTLDVYELRYTSYGSDACALETLSLEAWLAVPQGASAADRVPGLVVAHGLGGNADAGAAITPAAQLGAAVLAYSGPGQGGSEGWGSEPDHLFDVVHSPKDSWFWEHAVGAIRGLSLLEDRPEVDPSRLGMSGYSGGAVATWMVNGVDDRIIAAMPVSGTGHLDLAASTVPQPGWEVDLLAAMTPPRDTTSYEWQTWVDTLDPARFIPWSHGAMLVVNGAQDEFFPIHSLSASWTDLLGTGDAHRLLTIPDWDHGWFALFAGDRPAEDVDNAFNYWFNHHFNTASWAQPLVAQPELVGVSPWLCESLFWAPCAMATAIMPPVTGLETLDATLYWSQDGLAYLGWPLAHQGSGIWAAEVPLFDAQVINPTNAVFFVQFTVRTGTLGFGPTFRVTTAPSLPAGFQPLILPIDGPLPL